MLSKGNLHFGVFFCCCCFNHTNEVYNLKCHHGDEREERGCCLRTWWKTHIDLGGPLRQREGEERGVTQGAWPVKAPRQEELTGGAAWPVGQAVDWDSMALSSEGKHGWASRRGGVGSDACWWGERSGGQWRPSIPGCAIFQCGDASSLEFPCSSSLWLGPLHFEMCLTITRESTRVYAIRYTTSVL